MLLVTCLVFRTRIAFQSEVRFCLHGRRRSIPMSCDTAKTTKHTSLQDHIPTETSVSGASCRETMGELVADLRCCGRMLISCEAPVIPSPTRRSPSGKELQLSSHPYKHLILRSLRHSQDSDQENKVVHASSWKNAQLDA
jgi:hypothetical protein